MERMFSLAYLTIPGVDPFEQIRIAAEAGYDCVSLRTIPMGLPGEARVCLEDDPKLFLEIKKELKASGLKLLDIELVRIREDLPSDYRRAFEAGADLGATQVLSSVWTEDHSFAADQYGKICEQAKEYGLTVNLEFPIVSQLQTLEDAIKVQDQVNASNFKLLMDMIYCHWAGVTREVIKQTNPDRFGVLHLCDCPRDLKGMETVQIVREGREYCGKGVIDLEGLLTSLPTGYCSIELPNTAHIKAYGALGHAKRCLEEAKKTLERIDE